MNIPPNVLHSECSELPQPAPQAGSWTLHSAAAFCRIIEQFAPNYGCHVALTGGALYKDGPRKDCDILFYRIRQAQQIDIDGLKRCLAGIGVEILGEHGWVHKAKFLGQGVDMFFPEDYPEICESYDSQE